MDAQQFIAEFGHIANAPGGTSKLRELVLHLAITGRLVKQRIDDSNIENSLTELSSRRQKLISDRNLSATRKHKNLEKPEALFSVPNSWRWEFLGYISLWPLKDGDWIESKDQDLNGDIRIIQLADVGVGSYRDRSDRFLTKTKATELGCYFLEQNDVLIARLPDPIGRACLFPGDSKPSVTVVDIAVCRCDPEIVEPRFLMNCLNSPIISRLIKSWAVGTTRQRVATGRLGAIPLPIAPIEEQSRIVKKVDELMALCDKLEEQQQARRKLQNSLRLSTLQAVANATSPHELQTNWIRLADIFGHLFRVPKDIDEFVAELKNMAVRGSLSLPSTSVSPVDAIVADCDSLRDQYVIAGLMRRQKIISIAESEVVYPKHWGLAPFDKVAVVTGGVTKGRDLSGRDVVTCPYLAVANVQRGFFKLNDLKTIQIGKEELNKYLLQEDDLLITEGGDWDKVGRTAIWRGGVNNCLHQNHVFKARVPSTFLLNEWVELVFNSRVGRDYFAGASKQTTNLASINMTQLRSFPMPIPPLDEQRSILAKLDVLTKQTGVWRNQLERKLSVASMLADATIATFTGIAIEQKEEPMKAPQTELVALLRLGTTPDIKAQAPLATMLARQNGEMSAKDLWQRFGGEIDAFYAQLKTEVAHGWILEPQPAEMREKINDKEVD